MDITKIGHLLKIFEIGRAYVVGRAIGSITVCLTLATYLTLMGFSFGVFEIVGLIVLINIFIFVSGYFWIKFGLLDAETYSRNLNNPQNIEILRRVKKIEEHIISKCDNEE